MARKVVRVPYIGLANILLDEAVMPELIQEDATVEHIVQTVLPLLQEREEAMRQREKFTLLRTLLGHNDPAETVATMAMQMAGIGKPSQC